MSDRTPTVADICSCGHRRMQHGKIKYPLACSVVGCECQVFLLSRVHQQPTVATPVHDGPCRRSNTGMSFGWSCEDCGHTSLVHKGIGNSGLDACVLCELVLLNTELREVIRQAKENRDA